MKSFYLFLAFANILLCCCVQLCISKKDKEEDPNVQIVIPNYITYNGTSGETLWNKKKFLMFRDIQYAEVEERFQKPIPYAPSKDEVFDATSDSYNCYSLQRLEEIEIYDDLKVEEYCLFLSVSTKNKTGNLPVMVHLSGYDIAENDNSNKEATPGFLLEEDVVLVSIQYRVGVLGFLSTGTEDIPGNMGIHDIIEALRWVQKYISYFGGNPKNVVLFGQHHSAAIIHILTMTPILEKEELFHKVIYQSGSALMPNVINREPKKMIKQIAKYLNITSEDIKDINEGLKQATAVDLLYAYKNYLDEQKKNYKGIITVGDFYGILPEEPKTILKKRKYRKYPTLGGSVEQPATCIEEFRSGTLTDLRVSQEEVVDDDDDDSDESSEELTDVISKKNKKTKKIDMIADVANLFKDILVLEVPTNGEQAEYIKNLFPKKIFTMNFIKHLIPILLDLSSIQIKAATMEALKYNTELGGKSYLYSFNYNPDESRLQCVQGLYVVQLTDDDIFLFPQEDNENVKTLNKHETRLARLMVEMWTSFAATGKPEAHSLYDWPKMQLGLNGPYLIIDSIHKVGFDYTEEYYSGIKAERNRIDIVEV